MFELYDRQLKRVTTIYHVFENGHYLIFEPSQVNNSKGGNGWMRVKPSRFVPVDYVDLAGNYLSKSAKNKLKARLTLTQAIWTCSDGQSFNDCNEAVLHESLIVNADTGTIEEVKAAEEYRATIAEDTDCKAEEES